MLKIKKFRSFMLRQEDVERRWHLLDASSLPLGRLATKAADLLQGKGKVSFTKHTDCGDFIVIVNSDLLKLTGKKMQNKKVLQPLLRYAGGLHEVTLKQQMVKDSRKVILRAVKGMLPKNRLGRKQLTRCKVYAGAEHQQAAQNPQSVEL